MNHPQSLTPSAAQVRGWLDAIEQVQRGLWRSWRTLALFGVSEPGRWAAHAAAGVRELGNVNAPIAAAGPAGRRKSSPPDDLQRINGIGPALEKRLRHAGVRTWSEIAGWSEAELDAIERRLMNGVCTGRIRRDDWVGQARRLAAGGA